MDDEKLMAVLEYFLSLHEADNIFSMIQNCDISVEECVSELEKYSGLTGWKCTDTSCNQYVKQIGNNTFLFKEDRIIDPITKETEIYESEIDLGDYTASEIVSICDAYGYEEIDVRLWLNNGENSALMAECIFEMET